MHYHRNPITIKLLVLSILSALNFTGNAQQKIETQLKIKESERKSLQQAEEYLKLENEDEDAYKAFTISHTILKKSENPDNLLIAHKILASFHYRKYTTDSSLYYANKTIELVGNRQDTEALEYLSELYRILSHASRDKNLLNESKKWALKGIDIAKKINNSEALEAHTSNLAITYRLLGNPKKALDLFKSILEYSQNPERYGSIALCYLDMKNYEQALVYNKKVLEYYISIDNQRSIAVALLNIGVIYSELKNYPKALDRFDQSLNIGKKYNYPLITLNSLINIGEVIATKKEYSKAKEIFLDVLSISQKSGYFRQQLYVYESLKDIAGKEGKYKEALNYTEKLYALQDSINGLQKDKELSELEIKYETLKKEKEITILKKNEEFKSLEVRKQQSQKKIILYAFLIILMPLTALVFLYYQKLKNQDLLHTKEKEINKQKIEALVKDHELKLIKNSINVQNKERKRIAQQLHDRIGGNLAAIRLQFSSVKEKPGNLDVIYEQLDDTYEQVRVLSHDLIPEKFSHHNFVVLLKEYMRNIGNSSDLEIHITTFQENKINKMDALLHNELFSVFQELITNTIKHADASKVEIQMDLIDTIIHIIFEDNGKGFDISTVSLGIGLSNIKDRIRKLSGIMDIDSHPKRGTIINIEIPVTRSKLH